MQSLNVKVLFIFGAALMLMNLLFGSVFSSTLQAHVHREYLPAVENKSMRSSSATLLPLSFDSSRTTDEPTSGASV